MTNIFNAIKHGTKASCYSFKTLTLPKLSLHKIIITAVIQLCINYQSQTSSVSCQVNDNGSCCKMSKFTLILCLLIHFQLIISNGWLVYIMYDYWPILVSSFQGLLYFLYPVCGLMSGKKFKVIKISFVLYFISALALLVLSVVQITIGKGCRLVRNVDYFYRNHMCSNFSHFQYNRVSTI